MPDHQEPIPRRFASLERLYGEAAVRRFLTAHVMVVGVGGVGSWAAEALARSGIGELTLVDADVVGESNINRQLMALENTLFEPKVSALADRLKQINPRIKLHLIEEFVSEENCSELLGVSHHSSPSSLSALSQSTSPPALILDCVDDTKAKVAMALNCRFNKIALIMAGGAGGKTDPAKLTCADLRATTEDPLLAKVRSKLREAGVNKAMREPFKILCVYSTQSLKRAKNPGAKLACGGFGSSVAVTAAAGMHMAALALDKLALSYALAK